MVDVGAVWHYIGKVEKQKPEEDVQKDSEIEETKEESLMDMLKSLGKELEKLEQEKQQEENENRFDLPCCTDAGGNSPGSVLCGRQRID